MITCLHFICEVSEHNECVHVSWSYQRVSFPVLSLADKVQCALEGGMNTAEANLNNFCLGQGFGLSLGH